MGIKKVYLEQKLQAYRKYSKKYTVYMCCLNQRQKKQDGNTGKGKSTFQNGR